MLRTLVLSILTLVCAIAISSRASAQAITPQQRQRALELQQAVNEMARNVRTKQYEKAVQQIPALRGGLEELAAEDQPPQLQRLSASLKRRLDTMLRSLQRAGVELPEDPATPSDEPGAMPTEVSFTKQIGPLLAQHCSRCHIQRKRGGLSMASFKDLSTGGEGGSVIEPGKLEESRLYELVQSGEMPPGNARLKEEEVALLGAWIRGGAKFDGTDPSEAVAQGAPSKPSGQWSVSAPLGDETVTFSRDIAPILVEHCQGCHKGRQPSAQLRLDTFNGLIRGGETGPLVVPGKPEESLLVGKIRGTAGRRMPLRKPPLEEALIVKIETWIRQRASFDAASASDPLERIVELDRAGRISHDELADSRSELAAGQWRLSSGGESPKRVETDSHLILSSASENRLDALAQIIQQQEEALRPLVGVAKDEPLVRGRLTWFVFAHRFEYSEFGRMVEKLEIPRDQQAHWHADPLSAYVCLELPRDADEDLTLTVGEQLSGAYLATSDQLPRWFAQGTARWLATHINPRSNGVQQWDDQLSNALGQADNAAELLQGKLPPEASVALAYGFVNALLQKSANLEKLMTALQRGDSFDDAFQKVFRTAPEVAANAWLQQAKR
jgi:mono/diheme cytochrome c family protein